MHDVIMIYEGTFGENRVIVYRDCTMPKMFVISTNRRRWLRKIMFKMGFYEDHQGKNVIYWRWER